MELRAKHHCARKKKSDKQIRKAICKQLNYIRRDFGYIDAFFGSRLYVGAEASRTVGCPYDCVRKRHFRVDVESGPYFWDGRPAVALFGNRRKIYREDVPETKNKPIYIFEWENE